MYRQTHKRNTYKHVKHCKCYWYIAIAYGIDEFLKRLVRARTVGYLFLGRKRPVYYVPKHICWSQRQVEPAITVRNESTPISFSVSFTIVSHPVTRCVPWTLTLWNGKYRTWNFLSTPHNVSDHGVQSSLVSCTTTSECVALCKDIGLRRGRLFTDRISGKVTRSDVSVRVLFFLTLSFEPTDLWSRVAVRVVNYINAAGLTFVVDRRQFLWLNSLPDLPSRGVKWPLLEFIEGQVPGACPLALPP